ncbi:MULTISPECIES: IpaC/SipC family type III secretion system effector [Pseudomonas]|jgi:hypothetical protein|uniref:IpaC/SipC family type III secretion system effector n=1 Tax=Pseudomonas TaxID=286 RepID=UPI001C0A855D|nr:MULTISPECIES: IpaC/SipC family type III secretion system effector [Pseudomonas]MCK3838845.1 hypothetical protein [Pseudomonas sp. NCIMB 10586]VCU67886.1 Hypothetical new protein [Pseudomonas synxantha]
MVSSVGGITPGIPAQISSSEILGRAGLKQALSAGTVRAQLEAQVMTSTPRSTVEVLTSQNVHKYLDTSKFSESESQAVLGLFLATVVKQERGELGAAEQAPIAGLVVSPKGDLSDPAGSMEKDLVRDLMNFDPQAWEKHIGVFLAAVIAMQIAREASAKLAGDFTILAYEAAKAQGVSIIEGGHAAMVAAVSGAVLASSMAIAGGVISIKGHAQMHKSLSTNGEKALKKGTEVERLSADLERLSPGAKPMASSERVTLQDKILLAKQEGKTAELANSLVDKMSQKNIIIGGTLSSVAMMMNTSLAGMLRMAEFRENQNQVLRQSEQTLNKSVSDVESQGLSEDTALIIKMLEAIQNMSDSRNATIAAIANSRA